MKIIIFVGLILLGVGIYVPYSSGGVTINKKQASAETAQTAKNYIGLGLCALGGLFIIGGAIGMAKYKKQQKRNMFILQTGVATQGNVTFVDKNWAIKVNNNPIYSIVEYTYKDNLGQSYVRKVSTVPSEMVIRKQIVVGSTIPIKYLNENPSESVMVF